VAAGQCKQLGYISPDCIDVASLTTSFRVSRLAALAGILLPSSTIFVVLLCNDRAVLGPWATRPRLNLVVAVIISALLVLSMVLVISTVFPSVDVNRLVVVLGAMTAVALVAGSAWVWAARRGASPEPEVSRADRENWRMPALVLLERPTWSAPTRWR
jgi:hypothetical protein